MDMNSYPVKAGFALDEFLNVVVLDGAVGDTVSDHAAKAQVAKRLWGCWLCQWLSWTVETDHCQKTLAGESISPRGGLMAFLQLLAVFLLLTGGFWAFFL